MTPAQPPRLDEYSQRYHSLALAVQAPIQYKNVAEIIKAAKEFHAYVLGDKK